MQLSFGAVIGIVFCIAIVLFAVKKHVPAIVLLVCAVLGAFVLYFGRNTRRQKLEYSYFYG
jgi:ribose/xylose/arabinose/galactoside ABC-type transport system permease subunit